MTHPSQPALAPSKDVLGYTAEYWNDEGPKLYQQNTDRFEAMAAPFGQAMFEAVRLQPGERVLDAGCGYATTTIEAAELVSPSGRVVGVDISAAMLAVGRQRIAAAPVDNVELLEADAQVYAFEAASFDAIISRFGTMFFDDTEAALGNLARALRPGGRLAFACWQGPLQTEWVAVALGAAVKHVGRAPELGPADAPGPWAFADGDRITRLMQAS